MTLNNEELDNAILGTLIWKKFVNTKIDKENKFKI